MISAYRPSDGTTIGSRVQLGNSVKDILRLYNIKDMKSDPYFQHQNLSERRIKEVKSTVTVVMDRTGYPGYSWLLCEEYVVFILNRLYHDKLDKLTPFECVFGVTPDISEILCFSFYEEILYYDTNKSFPDSKEIYGRFVGF